MFLKTILILSMKIRANDINLIDADVSTAFLASLSTAKNKESSVCLILILMAGT